MMDIPAIRRALAEAVSVIDFNGLPIGAYDHLPDDVNPPFYGSGEVEIDYDSELAEGGLHEARVIGHVYTSTGETSIGQRMLNELLQPTGPRSVPAAIQKDRTLGGLVTSLRVERARGYSKYQIASSANETAYYGARLTIRLWGV